MTMLNAINAHSFAMEHTNGQEEYSEFMGDLNILMKQAVNKAKKQFIKEIVIKNESTKGVILEPGKRKNTFILKDAPEGLEPVFNVL